MMPPARPTRPRPRRFRPTLPRNLHAMVSPRRASHSPGGTCASFPESERPVAELEAKVAELRALESADSAAAIGEEISRLQSKAAQTLKEIYAELTPWQKTQVARHPERPHCLDYVAALIT